LRPYPRGEERAGFSLTVNIHRGISIALMITLITLQLSMAEMIVVHSYGETHSGIAYTVCDTLYFLNAIYIENSTLNTTLYMETPQNLSFNSFINQTVTTLYVKNLVFLNRSKHYAFQIKPNSTFYGFFLAKVVVCGPHRAMLLRTIKRIIHSKDYRDLIIEGKANETIPSEIKSKYILKPHRVVVEVLKPEFEKWVKYMFNVSVTNLSKFSLAVIAAYYIYGQFYITYTPSPFPRPIDYVIQKRQGDCDDMSRVLVDLLRSYGIPAVIAYGYVFIKADWLRHYVIPVENLTYVIHYAGPHAFTIAYVPGYGWIPLDLLAGSMLVYPFVFEDLSIDTSVNMTAVNEFRNMSRRISGIQLIAILDDDEYLKILNYSEDPIEALSAYVNMSMNLTVVIEKRVVKTNTTTVSRVTPSLTRTTLTTTAVDSTTPTPYLPTSETISATYTSLYRRLSRPTTTPKHVTRPESMHTTSPTHTFTIQTGSTTPYTTPLNTINTQTASERTDIATGLSPHHRSTSRSITELDMPSLHTVDTSVVSTIVSKRYANIVIAIILAIPTIVTAIVYRKAKQ